MSSTLLAPASADVTASSRSVPPEKIHVIPNAIDANRLSVVDPVATRRDFRRELGLEPDESHVVRATAHHAPPRSKARPPSQGTDGISIEQRPAFQHRRASILGRSLS